MWSHLPSLGTANQTRYRAPYTVRVAAIRHRSTTYGGNPLALRQPSGDSSMGIARS